jgi:anti-anti-sigma regulatory factor
MGVTTIGLRFEVGGEQVVHALQEAIEKLDGAGQELILNFSSVRRIGPGALDEMERLVNLADDKAVKVILRGVNIDIYKVLKLVKLAPRFSFLAETHVSPETSHATQPRP